MERQKSQLRKLLHVIKLFYTPICSVFILYFAWSNRILLDHLFDSTNPYLFVVSAFIWGVLHLFAPLGSKIVFESLGESTQYKELLGIHISRLPARYLPGGIWHTVGRLTDYRSIGISKKNLTILVAIETFFPCLITFLLGGGYLWITGKSDILTNIEGILAMVSICIIVIFPVITKWQFNAHVKENFIPLYILLLLVSILLWLVASISFLFYYSSVSLNSSTQTPLLHIAATYIFSWGVGYISVFAPQGIGVFEVVAGKLMELPMTLGGAIAFLAGFRIVALGGDGLAWLLFRLLSKIYGTKNR